MAGKHSHTISFRALVKKSQFKPVIFITTFALFGALFLFISHASTITASLETENGSIIGPAQLTTDSSASGGTAIQFGGTQTTVSPPLSIASDCSIAVDTQLASWIATVPDGSIIQFSKNACYGVDQTIYVSGRNNLTFDGNGATFKALTLQDVAYSGQNRAIWRINGGSTITLENMIVWGASDGRFSAPTHDLEWQHGVAFDGGSNMILKNSTIKNVYGDFVEFQYLDGSANETLATAAVNGTVFNNTFNNSNRQGIGISDGSHITIDSNTITSANADAIDIEPDVSSEAADHITINNNIFSGAQNAFDLGFGGYSWSGLVHDIIFTNNKDLALRPTCSSEMVTSSRSAIAGTTPISNVTISGNTGYSLTDGFGVFDTFNNLTVTNNTIHGDGNGCDPIPGGVALANSKTYSVTNNIFLGYEPSKGGAGAVRDYGGNSGATITGNICEQNPNLPC